MVLVQLPTSLLVLLIQKVLGDIVTVIASLNCFANGVDHLRSGSLDFHRLAAMYAEQCGWSLFCLTICLAQLFAVEYILADIVLCFI